ncbi:MAG TPA: serine hydrolase domain-containing protein [Kofleriaceae bacterium]|nr:serine hydrolase domain-containing protein [Kofleriaceae bacterium]
MRTVAALAALVLAIAIAWPTAPVLPRVLDEPPPVLAPAVAAPPRSIPELRARIAAVLDREHVPGVGIAMVERDRPIWIGGVGVADLETRAPVGPDTVFRVASVTKMLVGIGVMRLVEQGRLSLDAPLRLPGVAIDNAWDAEAPVTLAEVLEHTAGLDDMHFNEVFSDDDAMTPERALAINPRSRVVRWRPGTRMSYSNVGYTLAGRAIELATGEPFDAYLRREVLRPLGMADADFRRTPALASRLATGYDVVGRPVPFWPIAHRPAGALLASPTDLARLVQWFLRRDGTIVSPTGIARIERTGTLPYPATDVDYGLGNGGDVSLPVRGRGHDGGLPGFLSEVRYFPELGTGYAILLDATYSFRAMLDIRAQVFAYLTRDRAPAAPAAAPASEPPGAAFFAFASPRHELTGFLEHALIGFRTAPAGDRVKVDALVGSASAELVPTGDGGYRLPHESGSSVRFTRDRDGAPVMLLHTMYFEAESYGVARARALALVVVVILIDVFPLWALAVVVIAAVRRRRVAAPGLLMWPALASACMGAVPRLLGAAAIRGELGIACPLTIALCAATIVFGVAAVAGALSALRWSLRRDRPGWASRMVPSLAALAALGLALWFGAHGWIGLRTWAW